MRRVYVTPESWDTPASSQVIEAPSAIFTLLDDGNQRLRRRRTSAERIDRDAGGRYLAVDGTLRPVLNLTSLRVTDAGLKELKDLKRLRWVEFGNGGVSDEILRSLRQVGLLRAARDRETSRVLRRHAGAAGLGIRGGAPCSIS